MIPHSNHNAEDYDHFNVIVILARFHKLHNPALFFIFSMNLGSQLCEYVADRTTPHLNYTVFLQC